MRPTPATRRPRWALAGTILALHGLLLLSLLGHRPVQDRAASPLQAVLEVRLLTALAATQVVAPSPDAAPAPPSRRQPAAREQARAITLPAPGGPVAPAGVDGTPKEPTAGFAAPQATAPLLLDLPRSASSPERRRNPALDDPRANSRPRNLEARIGQSMGGDDRLVEEVLGDGRVRYRRGTDCILVQPARAAQIDPFNQSANPIPRQVGSC